LKENCLDIPVVLFLFKREKAVEVVKRIAEVRPKKVYLLGDQGRNKEERALVEDCRRKVQEAITWDCEIIKNYANENRGVYRNIGEGAKWVLSQEKWAIFLEDDNLPEITFFDFCKEMLERYEDDTRILWICGTNYLGEYRPEDEVSYVYTRHMLPCGWASWGNKFEKFYDGDLKFCSNKTIMNRISGLYCNKRVYRQYRDSWMGEYERISAGELPTSWDFQMDLSIKANNLFGICPCNNQIRNIGVDEYSAHGGNSFSNEMTRRFCGMESYPLQFPLKHPQTLLVDENFEKQIGKIILFPFKMRVLICISKFLRKVFKIPRNIGIKQYIKGKIIR